MDRYTRLSWKIDRMHLLHRARLRRDLSELGIFCGQTPVLEYVLDHAGCTQNDLCENLGLSKATVAISTKRLCRAGFLEKTADPSDMRRNRLFVTPSGRERTDLGRKKADAVNRAMFAGFTDEQLNAFNASLDRIVENLGGEAGDAQFLENFLLAQKLHGKANQ